MELYQSYFFFTLSGFILEPYLNFSKINYSKWLFSRLFRLYPVYISCFAIVALPFIVLNDDLSAPKTTILISIFGLQSLSQGTYLQPINPSLWSVSIEIIFALMFPLIPKKRINLYVTTFILGLITLQFNSLPPFIFFLFYLYLGVLIRKVLPGITSTILVLVNLTWIPILLFSNIWLVEGHSLRLFWGFAFVAVAITSLANIPNNYCSKNLLNVSKRTYSLYAIHWPVLEAISYVIAFFRLDLNATSYICAAIFLVCIGTEITYRYIEIPSINISKKLKLKSGP